MKVMKKITAMFLVLVMVLAQVSVLSFAENTYASGFGDSASYALKVPAGDKVAGGSVTTTAWVMSSNTMGRNATDTGYASNTSGYIFTKNVNGEQFFKLTPNATNAYATFINLPYNVYTSESPLLYNGIPSVINSANIEGMTFRVKGEGLSSDTITFNISLMNKTGATVAYTASSDIKLIDFATGKISDVTVTTGTNGGIQLPGNVDGILYVPVGGFKNGTVTLADSGKLAEFATTATSRASTNLGFKGIRYQFKGTAFNGKTLLVGDAMFVENFETYKLYHTAPQAPTAKEITKDSIKVNVVEGVCYSLDGENWNTTGEFTGLESGMRYVVYAAYTNNTSVYSVAEFSTVGLKDIKITAKTYNSITVEVMENQEYTIDKVNWNTTGVFENLEPNTEYVITTRLIGDTEEKSLTIKTDKLPYSADDDNTFYALKIPDGTTALTSGFAGSVTSLPVEKSNEENFVVIAPTSAEEGSATINAGSLTYGKNTLGLPDDMVLADDFSGIALKIKIVGDTWELSTFTVEFAADYKLKNGVYTFVDSEFGDVFEIEYDNGFFTLGETEGWIIIPFSSIENSIYGTQYSASTNKTYYRDITFTLAGEDYENGIGNWIDRSLEIGNALFYVDEKEFLESVSVPEIPDVAEKTSTSITLKETEGVLYSIDGGKTWTESGLFEGLTPNTDYTFCAKYSGRTLMTEFVIKTRQENPVFEPPTRDDVFVIANIILIDAKQDHEYSIDGGETWSEEGLFIDLELDAPYNVIARVCGTTKTSEPILVFTEMSIYSTGNGDGAIYMYQIPTAEDTRTNENGEYITKAENNFSWWNSKFAVDPDDLTVNKDSDQGGALFIEEINGERMLRIDTHGNCASGTISNNIMYEGGEYMFGDKGITYDIVEDVNQIKGFAFRIATRGGEADQASALDFYFNFADGSQVRQSNSVPEVTYIDAKTGAVSTVEYNYGIKLTGEVNGWFIVPIEGYTKSQAKFLQNLSTDFYGVTAWPHSKTCSHGASYSNWNDKVFYLGASVFLTDIDRFITVNSAPAAPELDYKTADSIKVKTVLGVEYSIDKTNWNVSGLFTGLEENTEYTIYARYSGRKIMNSTVWCTDMKNPPLTAPEADVIETEKIKVIVIPGIEYSIDGVSWNEDGIFEGLYGETEYTVLARIKGTEQTISSVIQTVAYPNPYYNEEDTTSIFLDIPDTPGDSKLGQAWGWGNPALFPLYPEGHEKAGLSTYPGGGGSLSIREIDGEYFAEYTLYPVVKEDYYGDRTTTYPDSQMTLGSKMMFGEKGVPKAINMAKQEAIAVRIKTVGMTSDMVNGFDLYINAAKDLKADGDSEIYIIDKETGAVTTQPDGENIYFTEDVDGWLVLPMECFYKTEINDETGEEEVIVDAQWFRENFSGLNVWLHGKDKSGALWADLGKYLYWGNSYFVEDINKFFAYHSADKDMCIKHTYVDDCDEDCNNCGQKRVAPHVFASVCDSVCDNCEYEREAPHYNSGKGYCDYCGKNMHFKFKVLDGRAWLYEIDRSLSGDVVIPETISGYPLHAIEPKYSSGLSCPLITSITIPNILNISDCSFDGCTALENIYISQENGYFTSVDGVLYKDHGKILFKYPEGRKETSYTIPDTVQTVNPNAFLNCTALQTITIGKGVSNMATTALYNCTSLNSINVSEENQYYSSEDGVLFNKTKTILYAYPIGKKDSSYSIPESVTKITTHAFKGCSLTAVTIPSGIETIKERAFDECASLKDVWYYGATSDIANISIEDGNDALLSAAWHYPACEHEYLDDLDFDCNICGFNRLFTYEINNGEVTITGLAMFDEEDVKIPSEIEGCPVTAIADKAFYNVVGVEWITMPSTLKRIGEKAFSGCYSLLAVIIPEGVEYIGAEAFSNCTCNTNFTVASGNKYYSSEDGVLFNKDKTVLIQYPLDFSPREYTIPNGVEIIESSAFEDAHNLTSITIPLSVKIIRANAFKTCYDIKTIRYAGSEDDRAEIVVETEGNSLLSSIQWIYNYTEGCVEHKYDDGVVTAPTITSQGYTKYTCTVCGETYNGDYTDALNKVLNVVATPSDVDITISWDKYEGADKYYVKVFKPDGSVLTTKTISDGSLSAVFTGLEYGVEYTFIVYGKVATQYLLPENATEVKASLVVQNRVLGLKSSVKGRTITVSWQQFPDATNYYVFVYPKGADPAVTSNRVTTVNAGNNTSVGIINAISPETEYDIYVSAKVDGKYLTLEEALHTSAVIPVTPPTSFEITSIEPTVARIKWNAVKNADRYWARLLDSDGNVVMTKPSLKALVSFTGLTPNTTYYVQLQARVPKAGGGSVYSGYCDPIAIPITTPAG